MAEVRIKQKSNILIGLGIILLLIASIFYFRAKRQEAPVKPGNFEEIISQEEGLVKKTGEELEVMAEEEIKQIREEVDAVLSTGGEEINLQDVAGMGASGKVKRAFSDGKFYLRIEASGLRLPEKGYFYQGWLKKDDQYLSVGRMEVGLPGEGRLYYTASGDRLEYNEVKVTLEPEDGNEAPAKAVLEGSF